MYPVYTFVCDPDECDLLIEVHTDRFDFPNGEIKMTCPCGRLMQYIHKEWLEATLVNRKERYALH